MIVLNVGTFAVIAVTIFIAGCCTGHYIYKKFFSRDKKEK